MALRITGKNIDLTEALREHIESRSAHFYKLADNITAIDVEVDVDTHHRNGDVHHVRMNVQVPHHFFTAEETEGNLYSAINTCHDDIMRQLRKHKQKYEARSRKANQTRREMKVAQTLATE